MEALVRADLQAALLVYPTYLRLYLWAAVAVHLAQAVLEQLAEWAELELKALIRVVVTAEAAEAAVADSLAEQQVPVVLRAGVERCLAERPLLAEAVEQAALVVE